MRRAIPMAAMLAAAALAAGCASGRYVGSIGRDQAYSNRGYGMLIRLGQDNLTSRWEPIDPSEVGRAPRPVRPRVLRSAIDQDGDGFLDVTERTKHLEPTLRLLSRTSTATRMDVSVRILGGENARVPLDALAGVEVKRLAGTSSAAEARAIARMTRTKVAGGHEARLFEVDTRGPRGDRRQQRVALIDQPDFEGEEGLERRQVVWVRLVAPEITEALRADFEALLSATVLARKGGTPTTKERW